MSLDLNQIIFGIGFADAFNMNTISFFIALLILSPFALATSSNNSEIQSSNVCIINTLFKANKLASLFGLAKDKSSICSGTLFSSTNSPDTSDRLLTAGHCKYPKDINLRYGTIERKIKCPGASVISVSDNQLKRHESYEDVSENGDVEREVSGHEAPSHHPDIMVIKLPTILEIVPALIAHEHNYMTLARSYESMYESMCWISGYSQSTNKPRLTSDYIRIDNLLRYSRIGSLVNFKRADYVAEFNQIDSKTHLTSVERHFSNLKVRGGDSGGPLFCSIDEEPLLVAVNITAVGTFSGYSFSSHLLVYPYIDWIKSF